MRKVEFVKPTPSVILDEGNTNPNYGKFVITPLERGYGDTIGNSLRRVLLSSLPGAAIVAISIEGVEHEFMAIPGVVEDVTEIILNIKNIILTINRSENEKGNYGKFEDIYRMEIIKEGPGVVTAGDIQHDSIIEVVNPDQVIATLSEGGKLKMELFCRNGVGYVSAEDNKQFCKEGNNRIIGRLPIDSIYTPIRRCSYTVEDTRFEDRFDFNKLTMEVETNGSITATNAMSLASKFLVEHFNVIVNLNEEIEKKTFMQQAEEKESDKNKDLKIEDLDLSVRAYNCLKRVNINTVGDLTEKTEEEMMKIRNLGRKSLKEVVTKLRERGLDLKRHTYESGASLGLYDDDDEESNETDNENENDNADDNDNELRNENFDDSDDNEDSDE
jgi:DNA-directed RNA polymerase subunit alpha